jgi:mannose/fructose/N-acetylgalactosamine-specific phosphotransferase system component IIB
MIMAAQGMEVDSQPPMVRIFSLEEAAEELKRSRGVLPHAHTKEVRQEAHPPEHECSILVVARPSDLVFLVENGVTIKDVSVGWMSFRPGKRRILETVSVDEEDMEAFRKLISAGVNVKYQASPSDAQLDMADYLVH